MNPIVIVQKELSERLKHPLIGPFLISFAIYNWRCWLFATIGDTTVEKRIASIVTATIHDPQDPSYCFVVIPMICGVIYSFLLFPFSTFIINTYYHWVKIGENNSKAFLSKKFDRSLEVLYNNAVKLVSYAYDQIVGQSNELGALDSANKNDLRKANKVLNDALSFISPIKVNDTELIAEAMERLRKLKMD